MPSLSFPDNEDGFFHLFRGTVLKRGRLDKQKEERIQETREYQVNKKKVEPLMHSTLRERTPCEAYLYCGMADKGGTAGADENRNDIKDV